MSQVGRSNHKCHNPSPQPNHPMSQRVQEIHRPGGESTEDELKVQVRTDTKPFYGL